MKAINIKYMGPTLTNGARFKVWALDMSPKYYPRDYALDYEQQAHKAALDYIKHIGWNGVDISGFGAVTNDNYVATLKRTGE